MFKLIKAIPPILGFLVLILGIVLLSVGAIRSNDEGANLPSEFQKARNFAIVILIVLGISVLIGSIIGIIGFFIRKYTFIWIFYLGVGISTAGLLLLGLALLISNSNLADITQKDICEKTPQFKDWLVYEKKAFDEFCSPSCPCSAGSTAISSSKPNYTVQGSSIGNETKVIRFQDCPYYITRNSSDEFATQKTFYSDFSVMETHFKCSGICRKIEMYLYSDIRKGAPSKSCGQVIHLYIEDQGYVIGTTALWCGVGLIFLVSIICMVSRWIKRREAEESQDNGSFQQF